MSITKYQIFVRTAICGSFTKAAEQLGFTQSGVSHAIASLEDELGLQLMARGRGGVSLTADGRTLLPYFEQLCAMQHQLEEKAHDLQGLEVGLVRVGTFTSVSIQWMPHILKSFHELYPHIEFELMQGDDSEIERWVSEGRVDCGFLTAPVADPLVFHLLYKDPMNVLLPERHPLTRQDVLTLPEIKKEPLVLPTKGSDNDIQAVLNSTRGKTNVRYVLNDDLSVISMVSHGFGITIMPELILRNLNYSLEIRPIDPPQYRAIGIASMPLNRVSVLTKTFIQYLTDPSKIDFNELCS